MFPMEDRNKYHADVCVRAIINRKRQPPKKSRKLAPFFSGQITRSAAEHFRRQTTEEKQFCRPPEKRKRPTPKKFLFVDVGQNPPGKRNFSCSASGRGCRFSARTFRLCLFRHGLCLPDLQAQAEANNGEWQHEPGPVIPAGRGQMAQ